MDWDEIGIFPIFFYRFHLFNCVEQLATQRTLVTPDELIKPRFRQPSYLIVITVEIICRTCTYEIKSSTYEIVSDYYDIE